VFFCIRDDDTSFFTEPEELERAYGEVSRWGPISLAVVPFHRAGTSKGVPEQFRGRWSVHPLHDNPALVEYLRIRIAEGRFEIMLHGYYHDEPHGKPEFQGGRDLTARVLEGRRYLERLLDTRIRIFVPPRNAIGKNGLRAIAAAGLHLGGTAGIRRGWSLWSRNSWLLWLRLLQWRRAGGTGVPWVLDLGDHREIAGNPVTPVACMQRNEAVFDKALAMGGVFCAATHYWELDAPSRHRDLPSVGGQLLRLIDRAVADPRVVWRSVGDVVTDRSTVI
jgi:peptidoglycan/xylan/chitin deacetylase (PgdA/CDA1 family)